MTTETIRKDCLARAKYYLQIVKKGQESGFPEIAYEKQLLRWIKKYKFTPEEINSL
jgi:hypothetical protein